MRPIVFSPTIKRDSNTIPTEALFKVAKGRLKEPKGSVVLTFPVFQEARAMARLFKISISEIFSGSFLAAEGGDRKHFAVMIYPSISRCHSKNLFLGQSEAFY